MDMSLNDIEAIGLTTSKPMMGYFCSYTPVELIHAAGFFPRRIFGQAQSMQRAHGYLHSNLCPYVQSCLEMALDGSLNNLRGVVFVNSCNAMQRLSEVWRQYIKTPFIHILDLPKGTGEADGVYFEQEIRKLSDALGQKTSLTFDGDALTISIRKYSEARKLLGQLHQLRNRNRAALTASEMVRVINASVTVPVEEFSPWLQQYLQTFAPKTEAHISDKPRILLAGGIINQPDIIAFFENCGADIVALDLCTGERSYKVEVGEEPPGFYNLTRAYLRKPPCARMNDIEAEKRYLSESIAEHKVSGVIYYSLKFCDTHLYNIPRLKQFFAEKNIKSLFLEGDYTMSTMGQMQTRIEAFLEMML
ncbi:2-hydroxyacyl-CoA dehydratase subunit D [candidate division CSSED10-310 bacterium]|uniref:2-hydroxyacyl-CoA dehydratase subunit D n=1 Tax=candidate division CSSED10-310 bacterium TaxID=2855610 RepID=A0ABV6YRD9_UNCC1